jgi:hypothetical protein
LAALETLELMMMVRNSSPYIYFCPWGPAASKRVHASTSRCSTAATILREGPGDANNSCATSNSRRVGAADLPTPGLQNCYSAECIGSDWRTGRLPCLRAEEHDKNHHRGRELQSVSLIVPFTCLCCGFDQLERRSCLML